mmetsp:Transcript_16960/g.32106  ORF Transcript_16960/g.32106 Transcript_16960/m.32106 type:complete len:107 (+) Transcript_16960:274-594(+)
MIVNLELHQSFVNLSKFITFSSFFSSCVVTFSFFIQPLLLQSLRPIFNNSKTSFDHDDYQQTLQQRFFKFSISKQDEWSHMQREAIELMMRLFFRHVMLLIHSSVT